MVNCRETAKKHGVSVFGQAAASQILGNHPTSHILPQCQVKSPLLPLLTPEDFYSHNAQHLRTMEKLIGIGKGRSPDRERAIGPEYGKRGTQAKSGHHHERLRGLKPVPRSRVGAEFSENFNHISNSVEIRGRERGTEDASCTSAMALTSAMPSISVSISPRGRQDRSRLIPYVIAGDDVDLNSEPQQMHKHKALQAKGWRLIQPGLPHQQRWLSPLKLMVFGLDAALSEAFPVTKSDSNASHDIKMIQVKQVLLLSPASHHILQLFLTISAHRTRCT
jgi:hypothetical protein